MSRTYELRCITCRETIWIGQGWPLSKTDIAGGENDRRYLYSAPEHIKALRNFLFAHEGTRDKHELVFIDDEYGDTAGWHDWDDEFCECDRCRAKQSNSS